MALILRGDLFWVDLPNAHTIGEEQRTESDTDRIWVVVSSPAVHVQNGIVIAVPLTTKTHRARGAEAYRIEVYADEISPKSPSYQPPPRGPLLALTEQVKGLQAVNSTFKSIDAWRETYEECVAMLDEMEREEQCESI